MGIGPVFINRWSLFSGSCSHRFDYSFKKDRFSLDRLIDENLTFKFKYITTVEKSSKVHKHNPVESYIKIIII
jgi:hypothetical protein